MVLSVVGEDGIPGGRPRQSLQSYTPTHPRLKREPLMSVGSTEGTLISLIKFTLQINNHRDQTFSEKSRRHVTI